MATYETSEFKKGLRILVDNTPYSIVDTQFVKPGKGQAFTRIKIKNMINGSVLEKTCKNGEKVQIAEITEIETQFLYVENDAYVFMDDRNYEQILVDKPLLADIHCWMAEGQKTQILIFEGRPVSVDIPNFVTLKITECEPGVKGDTATSATKTATLGTNAQIQVPLFIQAGDLVKVDTRKGEYIERVKA